MRTRLLLAGVAALTALSATAEVTLKDVIGESPLYGYLINEQTNAAKWNKISSDNTTTTVWEDANCQETGTKMLSGWMNKGVFCGFGLRMSGKYSLGFSYMERNQVTGAVYSEDFAPYSAVPKEKSLNSAVYDAADGFIYGYGSYENTIGFKQTPGNGDYTRTENKLELTDPYSWCPSLCIDSSKDQIYGITLGQSESTFVSIDKKGFTSTLATLPVKSGNATSALTYFPETGYFLWNCYDNGVSALYAIKLTDGGCTCEKISNLAENEHYSFFVTDKCADGVGVPALPEMVLDNFEAPSTSGSIMYVAPMMDLADEYIENDSWEMGYTVLLDGEEYNTGIIGIGSTETIEYTDIEQGEHTFGFYVTFEGMNSGTVKFKKYIGYDTPLAPQNVLLVREDDTKVTATWDAVTEGVHQAYIDTEAMEYKVFFNGTLMTTVKETTWSGELDLNAPLTANIVSIVATANGHDSESASSNAIVAGQPITLPVSIAPTEADAALMTYPASESGTWKYNTSFDPAVFSVSAMYGSDEDLNSWLILPAIEFSDASASYTLSYQNGTYASYDEESYEIWIGKKATPEDMTTQIQKLTEIIPSDNYSNEVVWNDNTVDFTVPEAGVWFIGFRAIAEQGNIGQVLLNINVTGTSGVKTIGENADKEVAAYYDAHGVRLQNRPERGFYITVFTDGTVKKNMSAR